MDFEMTIRLYRFMRSEYALRTLETGKFKVGRLHDLNDPFDCFPAITGEPREVLGRTMNGNDLLKKWNEQVGVISFSAKHTDPVIWSHYSDCHRGIALGFDYCPGNPLGGTLVKVTYSETRPVVDTATLVYCADNMPRIMGEVFSVKSNSWQYEEEYRAYVFLGFCDPCDGFYYWDIEKNWKLKAVILGSRCSIDTTYVRNTLKKRKLGSADVVQAQINPILYRIDVDGV